MDSIVAAGILKTRLRGRRQVEDDAADARVRRSRRTAGECRWRRHIVAQEWLTAIVRPFVFNKRLGLVPLAVRAEGHGRVMALADGVLEVAVLTFVIERLKKMLAIAPSPAIGCLSLRPWKSVESP